MPPRAGLMGCPSCPPGAARRAAGGPYVDYVYFEAATPPIRHDFVWSEEERREGYQEVPGSLWEALWQLPLGSLPIAPSPRVSGPGRQTRSGLEPSTDYTSGSCRLLEFLLHSFRDIPSSLASASDGNRPGQARCMALRRRCDFRWEVTNCPTLRVSSSMETPQCPDRLVRERPVQHHQSIHTF